MANLFIEDLDASELVWPKHQQTTAVKKALLAVTSSLANLSSQTFAKSFKGTSLKTHIKNARDSKEKCAVTPHNILVSKSELVLAGFLQFEAIRQAWSDVNASETDEHLIALYDALAPFRQALLKRNLTLFCELSIAEAFLFGTQT